MSFLLQRCVNDAQLIWRFRSCCTLEKHEKKKTQKMQVNSTYILMLISRINYNYYTKSDY